MYKLADLNINFNNLHDFSKNRMHEYCIDSSDCDINVDITENDIQKEKELSDVKLKNEYVEYLCAYRNLAEKIPLYNAFVMHSCVFDVNGTGIAFAAHSGTGKTTHMLLWKNLLGDRMAVVNGDKPIVRFFNKEDLSDFGNTHLPEDTKIGIPYAYGTPWCGKENFGCNMRTPLRHICYIERSLTNSVEKLKPEEAISIMMNQVYIPQNPIALTNTLGLINRLLSGCMLWKIKCNLNPEAAEISYNKIFKNE